MAERFFRIYKKFHFDEIKAHLLVYGALAGMCANCREMDVKLTEIQCPKCKTPYKYISFQSVKDHMPKMQRLSQERTDLIFIDYEDYKKAEGATKAEDFWK